MMQPITVRVESTPNPQTLKFVTNVTFLASGGRDYPSRERAQTSPLAAAIFDLGEVTGVYIGTDFVSVTTTDVANWHALSEGVNKLVLEHLGAGKPVFGDEEHQAHSAAGDDVSLRIQSILDDYIRPAVAQDGGDVVFRGFEDGIVKLALQGSCMGCPSSTMTLKIGIENLLKEQVPEVREVEQVY